MIKTPQEAIYWCITHLQHHMQHTVVDAEPRDLIGVDPAELTQVLSVLVLLDQLSRGDTTNERDKD